MLGASLATSALLAKASNNFPAKPVSLTRLNISESIQESLLLKSLDRAQACSVNELSTQLKIPGNLVDSLLKEAKAQGKVELRQVLNASLTTKQALHYGLTDKGRTLAQLARQQSGYVGPFPVSLADYHKVTEQDSIHRERITVENLEHALTDAIFDSTMLQTLGPALNSGRASIFYGDPGSGKTFIARKLIRAFSGYVYIPYAIAVAGDLVKVFDPSVHTAIKTGNTPQALRLSQGFDDRYVLCHRPFITAGGELTLDALDIGFDPVSRVNQAPLQLKANNGILLLDDLGRQRIPVASILNRLIVPMEEQTDYLSLSSGQHFSVPFVQQLIFSSNLNPLKLADNAFLRRLGYKLRFRPLSGEQYQDLWFRQCTVLQLDCDKSLFDYLLNQLHVTQKVPLLPCYPRDLLSMCRDMLRFNGEVNTLTQDLLLLAWESYFITEPLPAAPLLQDSLPQNKES